MIEAKAFPNSSEPAYSPVDPAHGKSMTAAHASRWNPLHWPLWGKIAGGLLLVGVLIAIIVGPIEGTKHKNRYPNYSRLNYSIQDRYEGEDFFDNFDYYSGVDPADGFVEYVVLISSLSRAKLNILTAMSPSQ